MKWGVEPMPNRNTTSKRGPQLINARSESILNLPTFRRMLLSDVGGRCVIPATGFYEWFKPVGGKKRESEPFLVRRRCKSGHEDKDEDVMFMAGLYEQHVNENSVEFNFVIITTEACEEFSWLHNRQPCFLDSTEEINQWLDSKMFPTEEIADHLLLSRGGLSWKRMTRDLKKESENQRKPKVQKSIQHFFGSHGTENKKPASKASGSTGKQKKLGVTVRNFKSRKVSRR